MVHRQGEGDASHIDNLPRYPHIAIHSGSEPEECRASTFNGTSWIFHTPLTDQRGSIGTKQTAKLQHSRNRYSNEPPLRMLPSQKQMSQACADLWIARGELCDRIQQGMRQMEETTIDVVWTFLDDNEHWKTWKDAYVRSDLGYDRTRGTRTKNFR